MKKNQIQSAFSHIKTVAGRDENLHRKILERIETGEKSAIPINGLEKLCLYFFIFLVIVLVAKIVVIAFLPSPTISQMPELVVQDKIQQIASGLKLLNESERLINLLVEGCFNLFFKIYFLAFVFAAALMKVENNQSRENSPEGEKLCAN